MDIGLIISHIILLDQMTSDLKNVKTDEERKQLKIAIDACQLSLDTAGVNRDSISQQRIAIPTKSGKPQFYIVGGCFHYFEKEIKETKPLVFLCVNKIDQKGPITEYEVLEQRKLVFNTRITETKTKLTSDYKLANQNYIVPTWTNLFHSIYLCGAGQGPRDNHVAKLVIYDD